MPTTVFGPGSTITSSWLNAVDTALFSGSAIGVSSFNSRAGTVTLLNTDVTTALGYAPARATNVTFTGFVNLGTTTPLQMNGDVGTSGQVLTSAGPGATPTWTTPSGGGGGSGTVTTVSVTSANGLTGTVSNPTTTPAISLGTSVTGLLKGNGTAISAAVADTDYASVSSVSAKQATLVSGTNIKTINGNSVLGSGDLVIGAGGSGTVTSVSVVSANGFGGTVATATTTPAITLTTSITGLLKGSSSALVAATAGTDYSVPSGTETLTNKRINPRVGSTTSSATPTINTDNVDIYKLTAQAVDITSFTTNLTGTPVDNQCLIIEITGTAARAITWGASFEASTVALPTTTVTTAMLAVAFLWNTATSKWRCVAAV